jgi:hypothetical protein
MNLGGEFEALCLVKGRCDWETFLLKECGFLTIGVLVV